MPLLCQENQGLGVNCIQLSMSLPWSLVIGFCCHVRWGQTIWASGRPPWTEQAQTFVNCHWAAPHLGQQQLFSAGVRERCEGLRVILECGFRPSSAKRLSQEGSWKQVELLGGQVLSTEFQRSLIWKSGRFPQAPAQDVNILDQPMHCQPLGKLRCLSSWGICLESITLPTLRGLVPGEVHSDLQHAPFCLLTPASNSSLALSTLGRLPPVPVKPLLVPSKFHLSPPAYPPGNPVYEEGAEQASPALQGELPVELFEPFVNSKPKGYLEASSPTL